MQIGPPSKTFEDAYAEILRSAEFRGHRDAVIRAVRQALEAAVSDTRLANLKPGESLPVDDGRFVIIVRLFGGFIVADDITEKRQA